MLGALAWTNFNSRSAWPTKNVMVVGSGVTTRWWENSCAGQDRGAHIPGVSRTGRILEAMSWRQHAMKAPAGKQKRTGAWLYRRP